MNNNTPPVLILLSNYSNDWDLYLDNLYGIYMEKVVNGSLSFLGKPLRFRYKPPTDGKGFGFWHLISEGFEEAERTPDIRRCERILWIPWILGRIHNDPKVVYWENVRMSHKNIVIWDQVYSFCIILSRRDGYYLFKTAYCLRPKREEKLKEEYEQYLKDKGRP
jgi:hypothetical protein